MDELVKFLDVWKAKFINSKEELRILEDQTDVLNSILSSLEGNDYNSLYQSNIMIPYSLCYVFPLDEADKIGKLILDVLFLLKTCVSKKGIDQESFNEHINRFNHIKTSLKIRLGDSQNKINELKKENIANGIKCIEKIKICLKNKGAITKDLLEYLNILLTKLPDLKQRVTFLEIIKEHNQSIEENREYNINRSEVYNLLNASFHSHTYRKLDYDKSNIFKYLWNSFNFELDKMENKDLILKLDELQETIDKEIIINIMIRILVYYRDMIEYYKECIMNKDFYFDETTKNEIINDYKKYLNLYDLVESKLLDLYNKDEKPGESKKLAFLMPLNNSETYLEKDLDDISCEYLGEAMEILNDFISGRLGKIVTEAVRAGKGLFKIKNHNPHSQIRFVYTYLDDGTHLLIGCFVKKKNTDSTSEYVTLANRYRLNDSYSYDDSGEILDRIRKNIDKNKRSGTRK